MRNSLMTKATRVIAWAMSVSTTVWLAAPMPAQAATVYQYEWVSQSGTISADGLAHEYTGVTAGQTINMSLTLKNRSGVTIKGTDALGAIPAGKQVQIGAWGIGSQTPTQDGTPSFLDTSSFVLNNNRFVYYNGADVPNGGTMQFNWTIKMASSLSNGTYKLYVKPVADYLAWTRQWKNGVTLPSYSSDIFTQFVVGSGTTPATGGLSVNLASGTPASTSIADAANANFTKITLTPASGASVSITSLYVTRSGLSINSNVENVKLIRASDNVQVGNTAGGFNANDKAQIFFSPALVVSTPTDYYIRAGILNGATAGNTVALGIKDAADIVSNATSISGVPVVGNLMTIVTLTIGDVTLAEYGSISDSTPDVGDKDVVTNTFQITAGATEAITLEQITALKSGTANSTDTANIELWNDTTSTSVATVSTWNSENKAVFNFSPALVLDKGNTVRFSIRVDIVSGSSLTVNTDIVDGSSALIMAKGNLYGYYITPTVSAGWAGTGDAAQTINAGALVISKSASTVPTGNITIADNQNLGTWDFDARGEEVIVSALHINLSGSIVEADDESNVRLYDENGTVVAGPVDSSAEVGAGDREIDFTQTFIVPVGIHKYTLKGRIDTSAADTETLGVEITAAGDITAKTLRTNTSVTATGVPATLNTLTVRAGALASSTLNTPAARNIVPGVTDFIWSELSFNASGSGEDVRVTAAQFQITTGATADTEELINMELWADLTTANSSRGDKYETKISNTEQPAATAIDGADVDYTITFTTPLTVKKDTSVGIAFIGDLSASASSAGGGDTIEVGFDTDASDVTASGVDTGTAITTAPTTANTGTATPGQVMTILAGGGVTITVDSSSPSADILIGGATSKTVAVVRAVASATEAVELDQLVATNNSSDTGDGIADSQSSTWYLYSDRDSAGNKVTPFLAATVPNGATLTFSIPDNTVRIPANGVALLTVKTDLLPVDGVAVANGDVIDISLADLTAAGDTGADTDVDFTGLGSGQQIPGKGTDGISNADHELYKSRPYISFAADTPSGSLGIGTSILLAKINITADAAYDIAFTYDGNVDDDDSGLDIDITALANDATDAAGGAQDTSTWLVNMATGDTLDTDATDPELGSYTTVLDFSTKELFVAAGATAVIGLYGNTLCFEDTGDSIQAWLSDATDNNVEFGTTIIVNGATAVNNTYPVGQIVLRGDKYAGSLVKA